MATLAIVSRKVYDSKTQSHTWQVLQGPSQSAGKNAWCMVRYKTKVGKEICIPVIVKGFYLPTSPLKLNIQ